MKFPHAFLIFAALFLSHSLPAGAQQACRDAFGTQSQAAVEKLLEERYGVSGEKLLFTANDKIPVLFKMDDAESLRPKIDKNAPVVREAKTYDAVVVGGGPAGLTAALYLAEAGKSVLILERNPKLGGLAMGNELKGVRAGGGAAYSAGPEGGLEYKIFQKIGLGNYKQRLTIDEPIDSYLWKGKLYKGIWEDHTLEHLPASFALFKQALLKLAKKGAGKDQGTWAEWADKMDMATLVRKMPELVATWTEKESRQVYDRFMMDAEVPKQDPMKDVIDLLDLYGRSALGGTADKISARQFIDFYEAEIFARYTGTLGTGTIAEALLKKLQKFPNVETRVSAPVAAIENTADGTRTRFIEDGVVKEVAARKMIFAAAVTLAPKLIKDFAAQDPEKASAISDIKMADYAVHVARVKGHPFRATYDTWSNSAGDLSKPTDFILGRWQDAKIKGYEGMREFEKEPGDDYGVITIYQPLGNADAKNFSKARNLEIVEKAVQDMKTKLAPQTAQNGQKIEVELVESYRWPESIHIVSPGYLEKVPLLARPMGHIRFANNTVNAPELETAMARAATEALAVIAEDKAAQ